MNLTLVGGASYYVIGTFSYELPLCVVFLQEEPFVMRHTAMRQHHELSQTLLPHLAKSLLQVEAATVKLKGCSRFCSDHIGVMVC